MPKGEARCYNGNNIATTMVFGSLVLLLACTLGEASNVPVADPATVPQQLVQPADQHMIQPVVVQPPVAAGAATGKSATTQQLPGAPAPDAAALQHVEKILERSPASAPAVVDRAAIAGEHPSASLRQLEDVESTATRGEVSAATAGGAPAAGGAAAAGGEQQPKSKKSSNPFASFVPEGKKDHKLENLKIAKAKKAAVDAAAKKVPTSGPALHGAGAGGAAGAGGSSAAAGAPPPGAVPPAPPPGQSAVTTSEAGRGQPQHQGVPTAAGSNEPMLAGGAAGAHLPSAIDPDGDGIIRSRPVAEQLPTAQQVVRPAQQDTAIDVTSRSVDVVSPNDSGQNKGAPVDVPAAPAVPEVLPAQPQTPPPQLPKQPLPPAQELPPQEGAGGTGASGAAVGSSQQGPDPRYAGGAYQNPLHPHTVDPAESLAKNQESLRKHELEEEELLRHEQEATADDSFVMILPSLLGCTYILAFAFVYYPQIYMNHKLRSARGLSLGYQVYNLLGFTCYTVYTVGQRLIQDHYNLPEAVTVHDAVSSLHSLICAAVILLQNIIYNYPPFAQPGISTHARGKYSLVDQGSASKGALQGQVFYKQDVINILIILATIFFSFVLACFGHIPWFSAHGSVDIVDAVSYGNGNVPPGGIVGELGSSAGADSSTEGAAPPTADSFQFLSFLSILGFTKVVITLVKYPSQIVLNFQRSSVKGLSRSMYVLDFLGGAAAVLQNLVLAYLKHDLELIIGNLPKVMNGALCCSYDLIILLQFRLFASMDRELEKQEEERQRMEIMQQGKPLGGNFISATWGGPGVSGRDQQELVRGVSSSGGRNSFSQPGAAERMETGYASGVVNGGTMLNQWGEGGWEAGGQLGRGGPGHHEHELSGVADLLSHNGGGGDNISLMSPAGGSSFGGSFQYQAAPDAGFPRAPGAVSSGASSTASGFGGGGSAFVGAVEAALNGTNHESRNLIDYGGREGAGATTVTTYGRTTYGEGTVSGGTFIGSPRTTPNGNLTRGRGGLNGRTMSDELDLADVL